MGSELEELGVKAREQAEVAAALGTLAAGGVAAAAGLAVAGAF